MATKAEELRRIHDECLAKGAQHEIAACQFCTPSLKEDTTVATEEMTSALRERDEEIARLSAQVAELAQSQAAADIEARVSAAKAEIETQVTDLQAKYDQVVLDAAAATKRYDDLVAMIDTAATEAEAARIFEEAKAIRTEALKPFEASFPDSYIKENADRFTAMPEEAFEALLEGWKAANLGSPESGSKIPARTAMVASSDGWHKPAAGSAREDAKALLAARARGVNTRNL